MADQTLEPFCAGMDVKCGTGHCGDLAGNVLKKWGCWCVQDGAGEIRRYGGLLYTRWRDGVVAFVDVAEGAAAFAGGAVKKKRGEGDVPFFTQYYQTKEVYKNLAGGDSGYETYMDHGEKAERINHYVDYYNDGKEWWAYCNNKNEVTNTIKEQLKAAPTYFAENPLWNTLWNRIEAEYKKHQKELDDMEYNYLDVQSTSLEAQISATQDKATKERLTTVQRQIQARMQKLRPTPPPAKKSGGMFRWFSTSGNRQSTTDMRVLLDELRQLNAV